MTQTHITIGAKSDFSAYVARNIGRSAGDWPVKKSAKIGERVVILIPSLHGNLCGHGVVAGSPALGIWGKSPRYFVPVDDLQPIAPEVPIALVRQAFPDWGWAGYARSYSTVPHKYVEPFWRLIAFPPVAYDNEEPPERVDSIVSRIVRDTATARALKSRYGSECQVCGARFPYGADQLYIEVHHLRPLGHPHDGPDSKDNMLVLCPNHHALFDLGVPQFITDSEVRIYGKDHRLIMKHRIDDASIRYYKKCVCTKDA